MRLSSSKMKQQRSAKEIDDAFKAVRSQLQSEVEESHKATKQEQLENIQSITIGSKSIPLKSDRLKQVFKKVQ